MLEGQPEESALRNGPSSRFSETERAYLRGLLILRSSAPFKDLVTSYATLDPTIAAIRQGLADSLDQINQRLRQPVPNLQHIVDTIEKFF